MSRRRSHTKHQCRHCHDRRAVFHYRGRWRARRDHDLCPRCFQSVIDRLRAAALDTKPDH